MKRVLAAALVASLGANLWLLVDRGRAGSERAVVTLHRDRPAPGAGDGSPVPASASGDAEALRARVAALEEDLAAARERASEVESLDPLALILYSRRPLAWRMRKLLEIEPEKDRQMAAWKLGIALGEKEGSAREILDTLTAEKDLRVVALLGEVLRAGAMAKAPPEARRAFGELLKNSPVPEVRLASFRGVFMNEAFRGGFDERTTALAVEMNGLAVAALRTESSPEVVAAIAGSFADWFPPADAVEALRDASGRLPPGPARRTIWGAIARGTFHEDQGLSLVREFRDASSQEVRDDIAAGIARAANSMGGRFPGGLEEARERFFVLYRGTSDPTVRRNLARATYHGLACLPEGELTDGSRTDAAAFFRGVAAAEGDPVLRERLEKLAAAYEVKSVPYVDYDRILSGK